MSAFKPYPELAIDMRDDGVARVIATNAGTDVLVVLEGDPATLERMVECWNALRKIAFPAAHISATDEYCERVERLRKEAWARVQELEANLITNSLRCSSPATDTADEASPSQASSAPHSASDGRPKRSKRLQVLRERPNAAEPDVGAPTISGAVAGAVAHAASAPIQGGRQ